MLSPPLAAGVTALVIAVVGAVVVGPSTEAGPESGRQYTSLPGEFTAPGTHASGRDRTVNEFDPSRDVDRELLEKQAEQQARQRRVALKELSARTQRRANNLERMQWVLPLAGYQLTATFGETSSLWSTVHTGLDFAAPSGTQLVAVAQGTVTYTGYSSAYGNRTVITLDDGTEVWYCHQTTIDVSIGDTVEPGEPIGTVGATGNVTGPHLHLEVRPAGGEPVDPYTALQEHGVTP